MTQAPCKEGDRIRLLKMDNDPNPIPVGTEGTVYSVSRRIAESHVIGVKWDNGRTLCCIWPDDEIEVIS
jgi:hypothetical protein